MRLFGVALLVGVVALSLQPQSADYAEKIALRMAPEQETSAITDDDAVESLRRGTYGALFRDDLPSRHLIELEKASMLAVESNAFYQKYTKPIKTSVLQKINLAFVFVYLCVAAILIYSFRRWVQDSGPRNLLSFLLGLAETLAFKLGAPLQGIFAKTRVRSAEKEFLRMKTLYENGLITEADFNAKKRELQAKIQKNLQV